MPPALNPETKLSLSLAQAWGIGSSVVIACVLASVFVVRKLDSLEQGQARIEAFITHEAVSRNDAERYASAFRWENRNLGITVPDPKTYFAQ